MSLSADSPRECRPLRAAVVGCGKMGAGDSSRLVGKVHPCLLPVGHAEALVQSEDYELVGFCDVDPEKAKAAAEVHGSEGFDDLSKLLRAKRPEVVTVATRTEVRPELVARLAASGTVRGIYAEKPFSRSIAECDAALEAVSSGGVKLVLGTPRRYLAVYREAHDLLRSGAMGALHRIEIGLAPGSLLLWTIPHFVDVMLWFAGSDEVETVAADCDFGAASISESVVDCDPVLKSAEVVFPNGVRGEMVESDCASIRLEGESGWLEIEESDPEGPMLRLGTKGKTDALERRVIGSRSGIVQALHELARTLAGAEAELVTLREIALQQRILSAIAFSSLNGGAKMDPAEVPADLAITGSFGGLYA